MDGRRFSKAALGGVLCLFLALVRCDGDGPSDPVVLNIGGEWIQITTVVSDECGLELPPTLVDNVTIIPSGDQITFLFHAEGFDDVISTGTWNSRTGAFTISTTDVIDGITVTAVQSGTFTSNSNFTSESTFVFSEGSLSCTLRTSEVGQKSS